MPTKLYYPGAEVCIFRVDKRVSVQIREIASRPARDGDRDRRGGGELKKPISLSFTSSQIASDALLALMILQPRPPAGIQV
ncbi:hypothetical protein [Rhizobium leguminosarum]|uniref:hypothetical protein n=1 Tax=Rhizobium leguminosarum TaxID=384 RepID=UPI0012F9CF22|nr:hypothetical protein [Rhizobium leguminosarum]